jgi:hypothetical protein
VGRNWRGVTTGEASKTVGKEPLEKGRRNIKTEGVKKMKKG